MTSDTTLPATPELHVLEETVRALMHMRSEASSDVLAAQVVRRYRSLVPELRLRFLGFLLDELSADPERMAAVAGHRAEPADRVAVELSEAAESPRQAFLQAIGAVPQGVDTIL